MSRSRWLELQRQQSRWQARSGSFLPTSVVEQSATAVWQFSRMGTVSVSAGLRVGRKPQVCETCEKRFDMSRSHRAIQGVNTVATLMKLNHTTRRQTCTTKEWTDTGVVFPKERPVMSSLDLTLPWTHLLLVDCCATLPERCPWATVQLPLFALLVCLSGRQQWVKVI
jgi:hypothetical protein